MEICGMYNVIQPLEEPKNHNTVKDFQELIYTTILKEQSTCAGKKLVKDNLK